MGMQFHSLQKVMWAAFIGSLIIEWLTTVSYFDAHGFVYVSYSPFGFIYYFFLAYIIFSLRGLVREKNGISGNVSEDIACSVCCAPCTINQLAHQTDILQQLVELLLTWCGGPPRKCWPCASANSTRNAPATTWARRRISKPGRCNGARTYCCSSCA